MLHLTDEDQRIADGDQGEAAAIAQRIVIETARVLGAERLVPIVSAHIDGALYHGDSGTIFAEHLVAAGGRVAVPTTLNVGALDLMTPSNVRLPSPKREMALRLMRAYERMGCRATWTCAPYQAGHRPAVGAHVAWGESNAVAFCNSVLGARTNRYGDFLDIACALAGRAPYAGLHLDANRKARVIIDTSALPRSLKAEPAFYPVLGSWYGRRLGDRVGLIVGLEEGVDEDRLKAFAAAAASTGAVGLFHVAGVTPEALRPEGVLAPGPIETIQPTGGELLAALASLSTADGDEVDAVAIGSPHLSIAEVRTLIRLFNGRRARLPFYACTGRHVVRAIEAEGLDQALRDAGVTLVADTCVVVTPILSDVRGVLMTSSGKFAHYAPGTTGYRVQYGSLADCVETAVAGRLVRDAATWDLARAAAEPGDGR